MVFVGQFDNYNSLQKSAERSLGNVASCYVKKRNEYTQYVCDGSRWVRMFTPETIKDVFGTSRFGDKFIARNGKEALFLRLAENAEYNFAIFYVKDWGIVQVFRENGEECHGDKEHDIISKCS